MALFFSNLSTDSAAPTDVRALCVSPSGAIVWASMSGGELFAHHTTQETDGSTPSSQLIKVYDPPIAKFGSAARAQQDRGLGIADHKIHMIDQVTSSQEPSSAPIELGEGVCIGAAVLCGSGNLVAGVAGGEYEQHGGGCGTLIQLEINDEMEFGTPDPLYTFPHGIAAMSELTDGKLVVAPDNSADILIVEPAHGSLIRIRNPSQHTGMYFNSFLQLDSSLEGYIIGGSTRGVRCDA